MQPNGSSEQDELPRPAEQDEVARRSRDTGGDAPAAASMEEREAVAEDTDDLFGEQDED